MRYARAGVRTIPCQAATRGERMTRVEPFAVARIGDEWLVGMRIFRAVAEYRLLQTT